MISQLKKAGRLNITILLIMMTIFCFAISVARCYMTDTKVFFFLNWNLFLAFVPWLLSSVLILRKLYNKAFLVLLMLVWLLFFPNSPYILTDLFHLRWSNSVPIWFDLVLILSFAWTGLMYGFVSLLDLMALSKKYLSESVITALTVLFFFVTGFGIYLGRYLRWNSWDVLTNPLGLFGDILDRFINPFEHPRAWGMTILMGLLLNMMFFSIKLLTDKKSA